MGLFGNLGKATFAGRDPFFPKTFEGLVEIMAVAFYESKDPGKDGIWFLRITGRLLTAHYPGGKLPEDGLLPGQTAVHLLKLGTEAQIKKAQTPAMGDLKAFCTAGFRQIAIDTDADPDDVTPDDFGDAEAELVYGPEQAFMGKRLGLKTSLKKTKEDNDFTQHYWCDGKAFHSALPEVKGEAA